LADGVVFQLVSGHIVAFASPICDVGVSFFYWRFDFVSGLLFSWQRARLELKLSSFQTLFLQAADISLCGD